MKMPKLILLLAIFSSLLFSCKKENDLLITEIELNEEHMSQLIGDYEWTNTTYQIQHYAQPSTNVVINPDSVSRCGISIDMSGKIRCFKNGVVINTYIITSTTEGNGHITATFAIEGHQVKLSASDNGLACDFYPTYNGDVHYASDHGPTPASNNFITIDSEPSTNSFSHYTPDCSVQLAKCGSYTGYELNKYPPTLDTVSYGIKTFYIAPGNPFSCSLNLQNSNQTNIGSVTTSAIYSCYIQDNKLYITKAYQQYKGGPIVTYYTFVGVKDE